MVRQERFRAGAADQKDFDMELARAMAGDSGFQVCMIIIELVKTDSLTE